MFQFSPGIDFVLDDANMQKIEAPAVDNARPSNVSEASIYLSLTR